MKSTDRMIGSRVRSSWSASREWWRALPAGAAAVHDTTPNVCPPAARSVWSVYASDRLPTIAFVAALAWFTWQALRLALEKHFSIDEFQYAHAAWLVAHGQVPYRDFFEVHFPLVYQVLAPVFLIAGDNPGAVLGLRAGMLVFLTLACGAAALANREQGRFAMLAAPALLLAVPSVVAFATEIRPDPAAFALFLASVAVLRLRASDAACAFASGLLLVGAAWGSQKAAFYGAIFAPALLVDLATGRAGAGTAARRLLRSPLAFAGGVAGGAAIVALYLTVTHSWAPWWAWCIAWAAEHQQHYPGFSWRRYFDPTLLDSLWLFALAAIGTASTVRSLATRGYEALRDPDLILLAALPSTFASFALQRAPYPYSFVPFLGVTAVFAARAIGFLLRTPPALRAVFATILLVIAGLQSAALREFGAVSNARQLTVLARIAELTTASDAAYDNAGGYVARPHATWYFYTDEFLRQALPDVLARDVPRAILEHGAVLHLASIRSKSLPTSLKAFLGQHFQPVDGDIALWGQRYDVPATGRLDGSFLAVRHDRYFVTPPEAFAHGTLTIDGEPVRTQVFTLAKGAHQIAYVGRPGTLEILWLPRDGRPWQPQRGLKPTFSMLF